MSKVKDNAAEIKHTGIARVLVAYLEEKLEEYKTALVQTKDVETLRQLQGRAGELSELINFFR